MEKIQGVMLKLFCVKKIIFVFIGLFVCFLMLSLMTFCPFDDTFFQFSGSDVFNICGKFGAIFSDVLFFIFGMVAYVLPCIIFFISWFFLFKRSLNFFSLSFMIIGSIMLLFSFCGLIDIFVDDFYYCFSGGIIGYLLRKYFLCTFNDVVINVVLLFSLMLGIILLTGRFWLLTFKKIKNYFLQSIFFCTKLKFKYYVNFPEYFHTSFFLCVFFQKVFNNIKLIFYFFCYKFENTFFKINKKYFYVDEKHRFKVRCRSIHCKNQLLDENLMRVLNNSQIKNSHKVFERFLNKEISKNKIVKEENILINKQFELYDVPPSGKKGKSEELFKKTLYFSLPHIDLLSMRSLSEKSLNKENLREKSLLLESKLAEYHIQARVINILQGPVITRFELDLAPGIKSSRIVNLSRDLARSLSVFHLRVVEIIPGKPYIGLEIPNRKREGVYLREVLDSEKFKLSHAPLTLGLGKDISGNPVIADLGNMPHLLIAGTTGSGKSVGINSMIVSILYKSTPENVRFIMIDPKILELSIYEGIPHLLQNVITDMKDVLSVLNWCVEEVERRYKIMARCSVRHLKDYNKRISSNYVDTFSMNILNSKNMDNSSILMLKTMPYIVIVVDEFADLVMSVGKRAESLIVRLSQKARACGMHLILATQRPSVNIITGLIKANIPSRIAFTVSSKIDSRTILDQSGAESLLGMGDMLYLSSRSSIPTRIHGAFVSDEEVSLVVNFLKKYS